MKPRRKWKTAQRPLLRQRDLHIGGLAPRSLRAAQDNGRPPRRVDFIEKDGPHLARGVRRREKPHARAAARAEDPHRIPVGWAQMLRRSTTMRSELSEGADAGRRTRSPASMSATSVSRSASSVRRSSIYRRPSGSTTTGKRRCTRTFTSGSCISSARCTRMRRPSFGRRSRSGPTSSRRISSLAAHSGSTASRRRRRLRGAMDTARTSSIHGASAAGRCSSTSMAEDHSRGRALRPDRGDPPRVTPFSHNRALRFVWTETDSRLSDFRVTIGSWDRCSPRPRSATASRGCLDPRPRRHRGGAR